MIYKKQKYEFSCGTCCINMILGKDVLNESQYQLGMTALEVKNTMKNLGIFKGVRYFREKTNKKLKNLEIDGLLQIYCKGDNLAHYVIKIGDIIYCPELGEFKLKDYLYKNLSVYCCFYI